MQEEAVEKDDEHDGADDCVEAVALEEKADDAHADAGDGRGDEDEEAEHDDSFGVEGGDAVKDGDEVGELRGLGVEVLVIGAGAVVLR